MAPSLAAIAESIQRQPASRWFWHSNHLAARLGITVVFDSLSPEIADASGHYVRLGNLHSINKQITLKVQRDILRYVTGIHQAFTQNHKDIGERRRRTWRKWVAGEADGDIFHEKDLPIIAYTFWFVCEAPISEGTPLKSITPTVLGLVKREITESFLSECL